MATKFTFRDKEHVLEEILEDGDIFDLEDQRGNVVGKIITRSGVSRLAEKLGGIDYEIGPIQHFMFNGKDVIAIECSAFDITQPGVRAGRDFGEASVSNCAGIAEQYPVAMAIKRGKYRALADLLHLRGVFSEDEAKEFKDKVAQKVSERSEKATGSVVEKKVDEKKVVSEINKLIGDLGMSSEDKLNVYRNVLDDNSLTAEQIKARATTPVKVKVLELLKSKK